MLPSTELVQSGTPARDWTRSRAHASIVTMRATTCSPASMNASPRLDGRPTTQRTRRNVARIVRRRPSMPALPGQRLDPREVELEARSRVVEVGVAVPAFHAR